MDRAIVPTLTTFMLIIYQDGARLAESVSRGKVASTLERGSWIDMGNFKGKFQCIITTSVRVRGRMQITHEICPFTRANIM